MVRRRRTRSWEGKSYLVSSVKDEFVGRKVNSEVVPYQCKVKSDEEWKKEERKGLGEVLSTSQFNIKTPPKIPSVSDVS
jgi:hypothetical protein